MLLLPTFGFDFDLFYFILFLYIQNARCFFSVLLPHPSHSCLTTLSRRFLQFNLQVALVVPNSEQPWSS
jgi:hypothetical protein